MSFRSGLFIALSAAVTLVQSHSWIDCMSLSEKYMKPSTGSNEWVFGGQKENGKCDGYAAGYPSRGAGIVIDRMYTYKLGMDEMRDGTANVCQRAYYQAGFGNGHPPVPFQDYAGWRKRIQVNPGQSVNFAYLPNGHVAVDKQGRGTYWRIYWQQEPGKRIEHSRDLNHELASGDFDDGQCGETFEDPGTRQKRSGRAGDGVPCVGSFQVPEGTKPGVYHAAWVWRFYDENNPNIKASGYYGMAYSTCFEFVVKSTPVKRNLQALRHLVKKLQ